LMEVLEKKLAYPAVLLLFVVLGNGTFVALQVPSPTFEGFGLTPLPLLLAETLAYFLGGYLAFRLKAYTSKYFYIIGFAITLLAGLLLSFAPIPLTLQFALQIAVYASLALLNLCWCVCVASFRPSVSILLIIGAYVLWTTCSLFLSLVVGTKTAQIISIVLPLFSLVVLGFCLIKVKFGNEQNRFRESEDFPRFTQVFRSVSFVFLASVLFSFVFGIIMEVDILLGYPDFILSPLAQVGGVVVCLTALVYVLAVNTRIKYRFIYILPLALATILMARAILGAQSFVTSGFPMAAYNLYSMIVCIVFAWRSYESKVNSFVLFALGLGSMRLGILLGRSFAHVLDVGVGLSPETASNVSVVVLWVFFIGVLAAVFFILRRHNSELLPFEPTSENDLSEGNGQLASQRHAQDQQNGNGNDLTAAETSAMREMTFTGAIGGFGLTERETEVLALYANGRSASYIADELYLSNYTVKTHLRRCYAKMGIHSRQELLDVIWKGQLPES